ncbi:type II CAAX prenyl endopeptidase Rce1 family protein [Halosegnis marinus]|uniref:CPBP family glutamic-type intramembrane protease n=1 Tax=Halosegnis marinus TaxID=3034023 RepID=UPI00360C46B5
MLYGGITEELLLRWGVLSLVAYLLWRANGAEGDLSAGVGWAAVLVSAVLFGVGHLPAAASSYGGLTLPVLAFVILGNTVAGVVFGWLYWRRSLEAAMVAHALAHVVAVGASVAALLA